MVSDPSFKVAQDGKALSKSDVLVSLSRPYKGSESFDIRPILCKTKAPVKPEGDTLLLKDVDQKFGKFRWPRSHLRSCAVKPAAGAWASL